MPAMLKKDLIDVGGGHNDGVPAARLADNEAAALVNFYPDGTILRRRRGLSLLPVSSFSGGQRIVGLFAHKTAAGQWIELIGGVSNIGAVQGGGTVNFPSVVAFPSSTERWRFRQYKDVTYATRKGASYLLRVAAAQAGGAVAFMILPAGLPPFPSIPLVDAGFSLPAGDEGIEAGDYECVVTPYNSNTGQEGNPSSPRTVTASAGDAFRWKLPNPSYVETGVQQVTDIRCYRSLVGRTGRYFFVGSFALEDALLGGVVEGKSVSQLGDEASFRNTVPPVGISMLEAWQERGWLSDGTNVYYSEIGLFESFPTSNTFPVYPDDGHKIVALHAWGEGRLVAAKTNAVHYVIDGPSGFDLETLTDHGCAAPESMRVADGLLMWFSGEHFLLSAGGPPRIIDDPRVRATIEAMNSDDRAAVFAAIEPRRGWYVASISIDGSPSKLLVYDYRQDKWWVSEYSEAVGTPEIFGILYDESALPVIHAATRDGLIYDLFSAGVANSGDDVGNAIAARWDTKGFGYEMEALKKGVRRVNLLTNAPSPGTLSLSLLLDGAALPYKTRSVDILGKQWRRVSLSSLRRLAGTVQFRLEYSGPAELEIHGLSFELVGFARLGRVA